MPARRRGRLGHLLAVGDTLLSREVVVLTNAIAFNFLLCLFPLLLFVAGFSQHLPGGRRVGSALLVLLQELIPFGHKALAESLQNLTKIARGLQAFSLLLIAWGSSGIFMPVEMVLNRAWGGPPPRHFWRSRLLAFLMTLAAGSLALLSVALTVAARGYARTWPVLAGYGVKGVALLLSYFLFFLIYRFIPSERVPTRLAGRAAVWAGSAWEGVKYLFVVNLARMRLEDFYGPLAFSVSLILWAYVSSLVLVFGALMVPVSARAVR